MIILSQSPVAVTVTISSLFTVRLVLHLSPCQFKMIFLVLLFALMSPMVTVSASPIACGETITSDSQLDADLTCNCDNTNGPGLTVEGPAVLDLNGHTIFCNHNKPGQPAVKLTGSNAQLKNGGVEDADPYGVLVAGGGRHKIQDIVATECSTNFRVDSDFNRIFNCVGINGNDHGFWLQGSNNAVVSCLCDNTDGSSCIRVDGSSNVIINNDVRNALFPGIYVSGNNNRICSNTAFNNGSAGIDFDGNNNKVLLNKAFDNRKNGILIRGGKVNNVMRGNEAYDNDKAGTGADDLADDNPCNENTWFGNNGAVVSNPCIK